MTEPRFARGHCPQDNDKCKSHAAVGRYVDMFQPRVCYRFKIGYAFAGVTLDELKRYTWVRPAIQSDAAVYRTVERTDMVIWKKIDNNALTIGDVHWLYPHDNIN